jgi:hypothetical protein
MVWGERVSGAGVGVSHRGSWTGFLFGDSFDVLYKPLEDICTRG